MDITLANPEQQPQSGIPLVALLLLLSPFYLNDFANLYVRDWRWWLLIDYTCVKLLPLLVVLWLIRAKRLTAAELGLVRQPLAPFLAVFLLITLLGTLIDQNAYKLIEKLPGYAGIAGMPEISSPAWNWIDLTLGLLAVGICEELVFRGCLPAFLSRRTHSRFSIVFLSSVAFGLIHWSSGLNVVLVASVIGVVLMLVYMRTRALPAIMLAHAAVDFIDFAGVVPKAMFKLV